MSLLLRPCPCDCQELKNAKAIASDMAEVSSCVIKIPTATSSSSIVNCKFPFQPGAQSNLLENKLNLAMLLPCLKHFADKLFLT